MNKQITWNDFEATCADITGDFEKLCRLFFKYYYVKNHHVILNQTTNNPGIETDPILVNGLKIGFQAKYFSNNVSYEDFLNSTKKLVTYYNGLIDKVIIFCNKDLSPKSNNYQKMIKTLCDNNIKIEFCCNNNILDVVSNETEYIYIKESFFGKTSFPNSWFESKLEQALSDLSPRYEPGFHISVDSEKYINSFYRNKIIEEHLIELIKNSKEQLSNIYGITKTYIEDVENIIDELIIPHRNNYEDVLFWFNKFNDIDKKVNDEYTKIQEELNNIYSNSINTNEIDINNKRNLLFNLGKLINIINTFDLKNDGFTKFLKQNVLVVEGNAGFGKSHLLGYIAEQNGISDESRTVLLLGNKFINNDTPQIQMMKIMGCDLTFSSFLNICETKGELDGTITVIMIDAINECQNNLIWKSYINEIIKTIQKYHYVKLICSVRTTYKELVFDEVVYKSINNGEIPCIQLWGFRHNLVDAIPLFFKYYKIPMAISAYFNSELENPLFLKIYCESYEENTLLGSDSIFSMYSKYLKKEEDKIKAINGINLSVYCSGEILNIIGKFFFDNDTNSIPYFALTSLTENVPNSAIIVDGLIKSKSLVSYFDSDKKQRIYISYEKLSDFIVAKYIISKYEIANELISFVKKELLKIDNGNVYLRQNVIGRFIALSVLASEKYGIEIIECIDAFKTLNPKASFQVEEIVSEYIESICYRSNSNINAETYFKLIMKYIGTGRTFEKHIELLLKLSGRECSLNANSLTKWLSKYSLVKRDYLWTIYINSHYEQGEIVYNIIDYFLSCDLANIKSDEKYLYSQVLSWLLTSSNRVLRDKSSRAIISLMKNDCNLIIRLLELFIRVNDPYIISRLFGCAYGAILQTDDCNLTLENQMDISNYIFANVFDKDDVYSDILLRDYALNIIEYIVSKGTKLEFDIAKCRPRYKSSSIPNIDIEEVIKLYKVDGDGRYGTNYIKYSLAPEFEIKDFCGGMYGDFGRYVFDSALYHFYGLNKEKIFIYAFYYIIKTLGYDNSLFSDYDHSLGWGRGTSSSTERIGKKYQWITMYHILALVTDHFDYKEEYTDAKYDEYKGSWRPNVRDFDPSLTICTDERQYDLNIQLYRKEYSKWNLSNINWAKIDDLFNFKELIRISDNYGETWTALWFSSSDASGKDYDSERQSAWQSSTGCLIKKEEIENFINKIKNISFYGRWFDAAEVGSQYNLFLREHCWSPAYNNELSSDGFQKAIIQSGTHKITKEIDMWDIDSILNNYRLEEVPDINGEKKFVEVDEPEYECIGSIMPCHRNYLWEEEYDLAKDSSISLSMPCKMIVDVLGLLQSIDGIWTNGDEIACMDCKLLKGSNIDGIYIKDKFLRRLLKQGYEMVWIGLGEKRHTFGMSGNGKQFLSEISSLVYENGEGELIEENIVEHKGYNAD